MSIEVHETPNPWALKFVLDKSILPNDETYYFTNKVDVKISPLAERIMFIEGVRAVFIGVNFLSVTVSEHASWELIQPRILTLITEHMVNDLPFITGEVEINKNQPLLPKNKADKAIIEKLEELFSERIRPAVAMDGGDIILKDYYEGVVYITMYGACAGCPSAHITLKQGIENMLKFYIPDIKEVVSID